MQSLLAKFGCGAAAVSVLAAVFVSGLDTVPVASAAASPITIALITSETGAAAAPFSSSPAAFKARIALQNALGGVNGHPISGIVVDDQTSPSSVVTGVQSALSKGAIGIVSDSPLFFLAAKYPQQAGVPVTGGFFDGPEWGEQPYTNMFAADEGSVDPKYPVSTAIGTFLKSHGGTVLCTYGEGISPSSTRSAVGTAQSFQRAGGRIGVIDTSIPFGAVNFTTEALVAKQKGCNALYAGMADSSNFALATAMRQAGVKLKAVEFPSGYEPGVDNTPAWADLQGDYFFTTFRPFAIPSPGTQQFQAAMRKYAGWSAAQFPTYGQYEAWLGTDLMIKGLLMSAEVPTPAAIIKNLRSLKSYNAGGILPISLNFSTAFGHDPPQLCGWYMHVQTHGFVATSTAPVCGHDIPGTSTASSS